jgi:hypothetical protein
MITNGLRLPLTFDYLTPRGLAPLYVGDDVAFRFCLVDSSDTAQNLTGASIEATIAFGPLTFTRTTGVLIPTTATFEIELDNQATPNPTNGTGWYQVNFSSTEAASLLPFIGRGSYACVITLAGRVFTHVAGPIDILART